MGLAALFRGRLTVAVRWLREGRAGLLTDTAGYQNACLTGLVEALAKLGEVAAAREALTQLDANPHPVMVLFEPDLQLSRAWVAAAEGTVTAAIALAHPTTRRVRPAPTTGTRRRFWLCKPLCSSAMTPSRAASAPSPRWPTVPAARPSPHTLSPWRPTTATHCWPLPMSGKRSATWCRRHRRRRAGRGGIRARKIRPRGDRPSRPAGRRLRRRPYPGAAGRDPPAPPHGREREIVSLAAQGLSNQQIADRLAVSVRTVEGHLYRASTKLGTTNRSDFATLLNPRPKET
ncbi:helix-turn-helix domain-containing protein [Fodinicola feengrottensis]|uniref:helix-turn-helix domain-containing protein n=1 Tax=Fodinicola feengrottensis TaxID=435914 RepID=UPI0024414FFE|nr:helix-turn-helix transcriptional regulator [Fodinicola feengrottensis]